MLRKSRIKAGALTLTLIIALILGILCVSIILLAFYNRQYETSDAIAQRLTRNIESASNLVLADSLTQLSAPRVDTLDLFGENKDSVAIRKEVWGIFQTAAITVFNNRFSKQTAFLFGSELPAYMDGCIYLADHKRPLSLVGNTKLTGDAYLSKSGVKAAFINQRGFSYNKLLEGTIKQSEDTLPVLRDIFVNYLYGLTKYDRAGREDKFFATGDSLTRSFYDSALLIGSVDPVSLENIYLQGHIMIQSDSMITVEETARLDQVMLVAPVIRFKKGFKGSLQAIATDSIIIEAGCTFSYPAAIVLLKTKGFTGQPIIRMEENCVFSGVLLTCCEKNDLSKTFVETGNNTRINGILYTMGYLSPGGNITGTVLTDYFLYRSSSMIYENHLVDIAVNRSNLSTHFVGSPIFRGVRTHKIVQWLQ